MAMDLNTTHMPITPKFISLAKTFLSFQLLEISLMSCKHLKFYVQVITFEYFFQKVFISSFSHLKKKKKKQIPINLMTWLKILWIFPDFYFSMVSNIQSSAIDLTLKGYPEINGINRLPPFTPVTTVSPARAFQGDPYKT